MHLCRSLAPRTTSGLADQPLSDITAPAKASKLAYYQNIGWYLVGALVQLRWSYTGALLCFINAMIYQLIVVLPSCRNSLCSWCVIFLVSTPAGTHADTFFGRLSLTDKAAFGLISLQYLSGGVGFLRLGFNAPAFAFATGLLPMLGALLEN